jgi:hypothetical protein
VPWLTGQGGLYANGYSAYGYNPYAGYNPFGYGYRGNPYAYQSAATAVALVATPADARHRHRHHHYTYSYSRYVPYALGYPPQLRREVVKGAISPIAERVGANVRFRPIPATSAPLIFRDFVNRGT